MDEPHMDIKKLGLFVLVAVGLVGGGYAAGRYASPEKVVVTEKIKVVEKEVVVRVVETEKVLDAIKNVSQQKNIKTVKVTEKKPDGTVTVREEKSDTSKTDSQTKVKEEEKTKAAETIIKEVIVEKEVTKTIERSRPNWSLALQPGFDVAGALGYGSPYSLLPVSDNFLLRHAILGVSVERRLLGPLSTGLWANSSGAGGITIRLEF